MKLNIETIHVLQLEGPEMGPHVVLLAGVHGDEYEPMVACNQIFAQLRGKLKNGQITIVPNVNPTAYLQGTRQGEDGLDLARICPGKEEGSASERSAFSVSKWIREADYLIDMHTGGLLYDIYPLAGYMLHEDDQILEVQRQMALAFQLPLIWGTESTPNGRTLSVARDAGIPSIYLEFGGGTGFRKQVVKAYVSGFFNFLKSVKMIEGEPELLSTEKYYWVEDARLDSGYLQGKMPSPAEGIYLPDVEIGQLVKKGDKWGEIMDPLTGQITPLIVDTDGLVFLMRNVVRVNKGDALGGILPISKKGKIRIDVLGNKSPKVE